MYCGVIKKGDIGIAVNKMQVYLNRMNACHCIDIRVHEDGVFGSDTRCALIQFQEAMRLPIDGVCDEKTWDVLLKRVKSLQQDVHSEVASKSYYLTLGSKGLAVYKLQQYYNLACFNHDSLTSIKADGMYGLLTKRAIAQYQYIVQLANDGLVGSDTWDCLVAGWLKHTDQTHPLVLK